VSGHDRAGHGGVSVLPWQVEVHPSTADLGVARDDVDGTLVMFIEPGTQDVADSGQLSNAADLSGQLPIAVDGGISRTLASRCREHGASLLIAGRALLAVTSTTASPRDATRSERGFQP
jgi:pentose-5-phosphate-3-epimerase